MEYALINTIIASIVTAFLFGMVAKQLKLPAIFGYLLAGVAIGPHTPGFVADISLAKQLAEIGIILLMFGVGLHFSLKDLLESRRIAFPGAVVQIFSATLVGGMVGLWFGNDITASIIFGFSLSVASTIVLIRSLEQRKLLESKGGKVAISWLIIEDIAMVFALVMLPVLAQMSHASSDISAAHITKTVLEVVFKISGFFVFMAVVGRRLLPWLLVKITKIGSEELNTLGSLAIALGFAMIAYAIFDASLALGAFLAGVMLNESEIGRKSADSSVQMRDAFSVLFFVSVGMLFDPSTLIKQPLAVALTFMTIVGAKSMAALIITRLFNQPWNVSYPVAIGLAQIGEFSFILSGLALTKGLITHDLYNLVLAGAMLSIIVNPFLFRIYDWRVARAK
ncbi:MAG: cation:proton antiporter [Alphaproteobacteria bacterium]|nr:cation:proton antiporter [Alphaproteobacteria bacterium]